MAMGEARGQVATLQVEMVSVDELVPAECRYRKLDVFVDWSFVRAEAASYYAEGLGRPSVDPVVLVKLLLVGALEGVSSMRELCRVASMRLDIRRFLGYGFSERLPVHQTLSHAQTRRFVDGLLFERLFLRSVALCHEHGLLDGTHLSVDGFHAEANAALSSLRASLAAAAVPELGAEECEPGAEPPPGAQPKLALAEPRSGPTPKRRSSNATAVSRTDPDAKLRGKPGQRPHLIHLGAVAVDPKARCVVACLGESAAGFEGDVLLPLLERARFACPELASVGADSGFAAERVWRALSERGLTAYIPPQPQKLPAHGQAKTEAQHQALAARERCKSERGIWAHRRRMADAEGVIGELKSRQTAGRARSRGTPLYHLQLVLDCAALNYKRLADHADEAHSGAAAGSQRASTAEPTASGLNPADRRTETAAIVGALQHRLSGSAAVWRHSACLN